ncbi:DNA repair protein [Avibacterium avium]|uniref:DNA repair protein n=1 Tax=Avibacterium avium TaxID=751 RepID=UPI003BF8F0CC
MASIATDKPEFDWAGELEKTVVNSLVTTFGLDFLLFEDKRGGDVDTIHKAREYQKEIKENKNSTIYVSDNLASQLDANGRNIDPYKKVQYDQQGNPKINSKGKLVKQDDYHVKSKLYTDRKDSDKRKEDAGAMTDGYTGAEIHSNDIKKSQDGYVTELDHVVAASEVHDDAGRILSGVDGVELANSEDNLVSTHWVINNAKSDHDLKTFIAKGGIRDQKVERMSENISQKKLELNNGKLSQEEKNRLEKEINDLERKKQILESLDEEKCLNIEKLARNKYNNKVNWGYYASSKFFKSTAVAAGKKGLQMGIRQALGFILAEVWFELRERIPEIYQELKQNFTIAKFLEKIAVSLENIFNRVKKRFKDIISAFKDGALSGILGSISTTVMNIFLVSEKIVVKLIREMWNSLVSVIKLIAFNPDKLDTKMLFKSVLKLLGAGLATALGAMLNAHLASMLVFPMGDLISAFLSALATGVMTLAFGYFIENGLSLQFIWDIINSYKQKYEVMINHMKEINAELDRYLLQWAEIEFNLKPDEIMIFADSLEACNSELERSLVLKQEIERRNIDLPFDLGDVESARKWLASLAKNA